MYSFKYKTRIRYADTDQMGYVYYGNYAKFYEIGRVETIRSLGLSYTDWEIKSGIILPVVFMESRYIKPAFYDEEIEIETILDEIPSKMVTFNHLISNESGELINKGIVKLFFIDIKTNKRVSAPDELTNKLQAFF
ncbi:MAG: thioesterase family protein [Saprospiraceae bacterium]